MMATLPPIIDLEQLSSYESAVRVVNLILEFALRCRGRPVPSEAELRKAAEIRLIGWTQREYFAKELAKVMDGERPSGRSPLASFALFIAEAGLLRARTWLTKEPHFGYDEKNPIV